MAAKAKFSSIMICPSTPTDVRFVSFFVPKHCSIVTWSCWKSYFQQLLVVVTKTKPNQALFPTTFSGGYCTNKLTKLTERARLKSQSYESTERGKRFKSKGRNSHKTFNRTPCLPPAGAFSSTKASQMFP